MEITETETSALGSDGPKRDGLRVHHVGRIPDAVQPDNAAQRPRMPHAALIRRERALPACPGVT